MPESVHEQIGAYIAARVAEITVAAGYPYTIERVARVSEPKLNHWTEARVRGVNCFALVFPGEDEPAFARSTESVTKDMEVGIVASRRSELDRKTANTEAMGGEPIFPDNASDVLPAMWTVQNRLLKSIKDKLSLDLTFGGLAT